MRNTITAFGLVIVTAAVAAAHCDSIDGPVVTAAREALAAGDAGLVLPWVQPKDEASVRQAFARTLAVRRFNPEARDLADTWFFETVVRIHRAGEGAPYDGLKPAGYHVNPAIAAADTAIKTGSDENLVKTLTAAAREGTHERLHAVLEAKDYKSSDVNAGRKYVAAYVQFIHFVEGLHTAVSGSTEHGK